MTTIRCNGEGNNNTGVGILIQGNGNKVDTADSFANGSHGIQVTGNNNVLLKVDVGELGKGNHGHGILLSGSGNLLQENTVYSNGGDGIEVSGGTTGSPNRLFKNIAGSRGKGNKGNGIVVSGTGNGTALPIEIEQNTAKANTLNGFKIDGSGHQLRNNVSGGSTAGENNGKCEYLMASANINATGNKSNGVTIAGTNGSPFPTGCIGSP